MLLAIDHNQLYNRNFVSMYDEVFSADDIRYLLDENIIQATEWEGKPCYELTKNGKRYLNLATGFYWYLIKQRLGWYKFKTWLYNTLNLW